MKLIGVMIGSDNPKVLGEFYNKVLGKAGWGKDDWYAYDVGGGSLMIGSHSEVKGKNDTPGRLIISIVADDIQADFKRIKDLGVDVIAEPYQPSKDENPSTWLATFADPDGNYFQLSTPWEN